VRVDVSLDRTDGDVDVFETWFGFLQLGGSLTDTTIVPIPLPGMDMEELPPPQPPAILTNSRSGKVQGQDSGQGHAHTRKFFMEFPRARLEAQGEPSLTSPNPLIYKAL